MAGHVKISDWVRLIVESVLAVAAVGTLIMTAQTLDKQAEANHLAAFAAVDEIYTVAKWRFLDALKETPEEKREEAMHDDTDYAHAYWEVVRVNDIVLRLLAKDIVTGPTADILKDEYVLSTFRTLASVNCSHDINLRKDYVDSFVARLQEKGVDESERFMREESLCPD